MADWFNFSLHFFLCFCLSVQSCGMLPYTPSSAILHSYGSCLCKANTPPPPSSSSTHHEPTPPRTLQSPSPATVSWSSFLS